MSFRTRSTLTAAARLLALDVGLIAIWRYGRHATWTSIVPWAAGFLLLTLAVTAYRWWWLGDPEHLELMQMTPAERQARARLK
ncbi:MULTISPECIES: hypothetical protein [unclassified Streptomyces]|uniref:hypothetical protein n=1 Tax=unclassified Streptomyces TaxID=2593676 RepID=UPI00114CDEA3|nr:MULTISPECIES: hypothetical protein [unclassified Streptomyces]MYS19362.1 hypothetical protein [Streptomyces sp. SID4948]